MIFLTSILVWSNCNTPKQKSWNLAPKGMQECPSKPLVFQDQTRVKSPHPSSSLNLFFDSEICLDFGHELRTLSRDQVYWFARQLCGALLVLLFLCHCRFLEDLNCFLQIGTKRHLYVLVTSTTPLHRRIYWFESRHKPTKQQNPTNRNDVWLYDRLRSGLLEWNAVITVYGK